MNGSVSGPFVEPLLKALYRRGPFPLRDSHSFVCLLVCDQLACASSAPLFPPHLRQLMLCCSISTEGSFWLPIALHTHCKQPGPYSGQVPTAPPMMTPRVRLISLAFLVMAGLIACAAAASSSLPAHTSDASTAALARPQVTSTGRLRRLLTEAHSVQGRRLAALRRYRRKAVKQIVRNRMKRVVSKTMCKAMCTWDPLRMSCVNSNHVRC